MPPIRLSAPQLWRKFRSIPAFDGISSVMFNTTAVDVPDRFASWRKGHLPSDKRHSQSSISLNGNIHSLYGLTCCICHKLDDYTVWSKRMYGTLMNYEYPGIHVCASCAHLIPYNDLDVAMDTFTYHQDFFTFIIARLMSTPARLRKVMTFRKPHLP